MSVSNSDLDGLRGLLNLEQIRLVADCLPLLAWSCRPDGYCDYLSRRWVEFTGVPESEHHALGWLDAIHPDDRARTHAIWDAFVTGKAKYDVDYRLRRHDGVYLWFKTRGVLIHDFEGRPARVVGTTTEIDGQKQAEAQFRESRERLEAALVASATGTFRWDIATGKLDGDAQFHRLVGVDPDIKFVHIEQLVSVLHEDDRERFLESLQQCKELGRNFELEFRVRLPDGELRWLLGRGQTFHGEDGRPVYLTGACVSVTERKLAEEQIREIDERAAFVRMASGVGFWYCDLPFDVLVWDSQVKEHFHLAPDASVTINTFYDSLHPEDREPTQQAIDRSISTRQPYDVLYRTVCQKTEAEKWIRAIGRAVYSADGAPKRFDGITIDVTKTQRAELRRQFLIELATATQPLEDPEEVTAITARMLAEYLGASRCAYAEIEDESVYVITGDYTRDVSSIVGRWSVAAFGAEHLRLMLANKPYVVNDSHADSRISAKDLEAFDATEIRAVICVPLHKGGKLTAAMAVQQSTPRSWRPGEVELVETVVGRCWEALERTRAARVIRESAAQLRTSEERFRAFMDHSPAAAWITDDDGTVQYVNATYGKLFQLPERELVGARPSELYSEEFAEDYVRNIRKVAQSGGPLEAIEKAPRPDGSKGDFLVYKFPLPSDRLVGGVAIDITERLEAESQLRDADRRKDEFLAILAHELRNPLAPLRNGLQVMRLAGNDAGVAEEMRGMMDRQLGHMVRLIDDLLDISRISRNKLELRRERVELAEIVANAVETARPSIEEADHQLNINLPAVPVYLDADLTRLAQVFSNLLTNAAKYTKRGGQISINAEAVADEAVVSVADNGVGIPSHALPNIFDMFSQVDRSIERTTGGLGIGLALVRGLVEMHGGRVKAESEGPNLGSTFTVVLPRERPRHSFPADQASGSLLKRATHGRRILVVDDNRDSADSMASMLHLLGHDVRTAYDGEAAVAAAVEFRPAVILMDIGLPILNGYEATRRIRALPWSKPVSIIAVTGWGQEGDREESRKAGCNGHLVKPVHLDDLSQYIE